MKSKTNNIQISNQNRRKKIIIFYIFLEKHTNTSESLLSKNNQSKMPEARISSSSKSVRYTVRELIKANKMDKTDEMEKMENDVQNFGNVQSHTRLHSTSQNSESNDSLSSDEENKVSSNLFSFSSSEMRIEKRDASTQKLDSCITGSAGNIFH